MLDPSRMDLPPYHKCKSAASSSALHDRSAGWFDIRPPLRVEAPKKTSHDSRSVTGIPAPAVELDDAFNCLDPGQLLRESAAAAARAAHQFEDAASTPVASRSSRPSRRSHYAPDSEDDDDDQDFQQPRYGVPSSDPSFTGQGDPIRRHSCRDLEQWRRRLSDDLARVTSHLIQQLTKRDHLLLQRQRHCDVITAILQAASPKRSQDAKIRFSVEPPSSTSQDSGFQQWLDAMRMVARLPGGVPPEFRRKLWLTLAEQHLLRVGVDWSQVERDCFNEKTSVDDEEIGAQIVRDLHRTGCSLFSGEDALPNQALLKRVLLAYARWNKTVGYCQGLNVLAALLLEVMNRCQVEALKVLIFLIDGVLPNGYYAHHLRGLSVDMAVLRDLLRQRNAALWKHLERLQLDAPGDTAASASYEPPLTNVFTMQWFLTLFATCLPKASVLRIWDLIFLEGNDVLLRTALAIWDALADRILTVDTADDFYSIMGVLAREILEFGLMEPNRLVQAVVCMADSPFPGLEDLRDKYRYNIRPWNGRGMRFLYVDDDTDDTEDEEKTKATVATVFGLASVFKNRRSLTMNSLRRQMSLTSAGEKSDRLQAAGQLDIAALRKQYAKLRERQRQAHVIWTSATSAGSASVSGAGTQVSHLLAGRKPLLSRRPSPSARGDGPRLKLPPPRSVSSNKASSAPTSPCNKDGDTGAPLTSRSDARDGNRRNSGCELVRTVRVHPQQQGQRSVIAAERSASVDSEPNSRSRLAQELLEQNSAILQKLKSVSVTPAAATSAEEVALAPFGSHSSSTNLPQPNVAVQIGLYDPVWPQPKY